MAESASAAGIVDSLRTQWGALQGGQRRTLVAAAVVVLGGVLVWGYLATRGPAMAPLFTSLDPKDGAAIVTQLDNGKVAYKLADNGATILVPKSEVDKLRLQLAGQGLPNHGTVGLSSVLNLPFGATDFTRQVAYQDALQGELERTIDQIQGVSSSQVQIVLPQTSAFAGPSQPASAAVLVNLQPGITLSSDQVQGIAHLVASSVQGLSPSAVTIVDQDGLILWAQGTSAGGTSSATGGAGQAASDLGVQQQFNQTLQTQLDQLLTQVFGPGNVVTHVQAQLAFTSGTVNKTIFVPQKNGRGVLTSMQELKQSLVGGSSSGTVAGTAANSFPTYPASSTSPTSQTSQSDQITQDYVVGKETDHTVVAPGNLSRLSVAVVVNGTLTPQQQALTTNLVEAAVGYDAARQDQISVVGMPFNESALKALKSQPATVPLGVPRRLVLEGAGVAAAVVAGLLVLLALRRRPEVEAVGGARLPSPPELDGLPPLGAIGRDSPPEEDLLDRALSGARRARDRLEGSLRQRPEDVARVVRVWLSEEE